MANTSKHTYIGNNTFDVNIYSTYICIDNIIYTIDSLTGYMLYRSYILVNGYKFY